MIVHAIPLHKQKQRFSPFQFNTHSLCFNLIKSFTDSLLIQFRQKSTQNTTMSQYHFFKFNLGNPRVILIDSFLWFVMTVYQFNSYFSSTQPLPPFYSTWPSCDKQSIKCVNNQQYLMKYCPSRSIKRHFNQILMQMW